MLSRRAIANGDHVVVVARNYASHGMVGLSVSYMILCHTLIHRSMLYLLWKDCACITTIFAVAVGDPVVENHDDCSLPTLLSQSERI